MKVLVIGSGGREHALIHTFSRQGHKVYCYPGNPGIWSLADPLSSEMNLLSDYALLAQAAARMTIDLTVVGSESHLEKGIQDLFASHRLALFGPSRQAALIESSKAWAKAFMAKYQIPTAQFAVCTSAANARQAAKKLFLQGKGAVVKASGLAGGKGVVCCLDYASAEEAIRQIAEQKIYGNAGSEVVIEELLSGPEISLQAITDGERIYPLLAAQDHKRLYNGDLGPNTGGMGAYAPLPFLHPPLQQEIEQTIVQPTLKGLQREGILYRGILYFGLMLTRDGPKVLEYNCRFGDPETQAVLPLLESDLAEIMAASVRGELTALQLRWKPKASCCVVLASKGYPNSCAKGELIGPLMEKEDLFFFHAGTSLDSQQRLVSTGGRVLGVTALGIDLEDAIEKTYSAVDAVSGTWAQFRRDIGKAALSAAV